MSRILVTGCSGFLASYLIKQLTKGQYDDISGITEITTFTSDEFKVFHVDIRERNEVFELIQSLKPDVIFHLAAISNVGFSWKNQKLTYEVNFIGSSNIIEAVDLYSPESRIILMGSAELYGDCGQGPIDEKCNISAKNPYALSKLAMEMVGDLYINSRDLDIIKIRSFNFTGPGQEVKFVCSDFAFQIAMIEKGKKDPVIKVGNLTAVRDISDVRDIARYLSVIARKGRSGDVYNLGSGFSFSIKEILDILLSCSEVEIEVFEDSEKLRPVDIPVLTCDCTLIRNRFGCRPAYTIQQTLRDILNYWREFEV